MVGLWPGFNVEHEDEPAADLVVTGGQGWDGVDGHIVKGLGTKGPAAEDRMAVLGDTPTSYVHLAVRCAAASPAERSRLAASRHQLISYTERTYTYRDCKRQCTIVYLSLCHQGGKITWT